MSNSESAKICRLCGEDCSKRRRAKDSDGLYYCLKCFNRRLKQVQKRRELEEKLSSDSTKSDSMSSTVGVDVELVEQEAATVEGVDEAPQLLCPACGLAVEADAVICVHCGQDFEAGKRLRVKKKVISRERPEIWPTLVGLACVAMGAAGLYVYGMPLVRFVMEAFQPIGFSLEFNSFMIPALVVLVLLSVWHGLGGALVWMKLSPGVVLLRYWALIKLAIMTVFVIAGLVTALAFPAFVARIDFVREIGTWLQQPLPGELVISLLFLWVWQCAWPIALFGVFRIPQVQKDIVEWDAPPEPTIALYE